MYQNFIIELEWRHLKPKGNSGLFVWSDALTARGQPFIRAVEIQILDGLEGPFYTSDGDVFPIHGAKMIPENGRGKGDRAYPTEKRSKPSPEWNHYRVECVDGTIAHAVNGKVVTRGHDVTPRKGYICLESEGSPIEFRNIRIKELPAMKALAPDQIAKPDEGFHSIYTGMDLSGWQVPAGGENFWHAKDWNLEFSGGKETKDLALKTDREYGDYILMVDWRWTGKGNESMPVLLREGMVPDVKVTTPAGNWNRSIFTVRGNTVSVEVNGAKLAENVSFPNALPKGRIALDPQGAGIQYASIYLKKLD